MRADHAAGEKTQPAAQLDAALKRGVTRRADEHGRVDFALVTVKVDQRARGAGKDDGEAARDERMDQQVGPAIFQPLQLLPP